MASRRVAIFFPVLSIDEKLMLAVFENEILSWCPEHELKLLIMDNDPKLHSKSIVPFMKDHGGSKNT